MESDSKDLLIEQLQAQLKQFKQVADSGLLSTNNSEDLSGNSGFHHFLSAVSIRYWNYCAIFVMFWL